MQATNFFTCIFYHKTTLWRMNMYLLSPESTFARLLAANKPSAMATIRGNESQSQLNGCTKFFQTPFNGVLIQTEIMGLPNFSENGSSNFYAMHIHEFGDCTIPFDKTGNHYNPTGSPHPNHSGDLLPLFGIQGYAYSVFFDNRFTIDDIIDRSVIIHSMPDDFTSQPSGNSGEKIGCGTIIRLK